MKNTDKITMTFGQLKRLLKESANKKSGRNKPSDKFTSEREYRIITGDELSFAFGSSGYRVGDVNGKYYVVYWNKYESSITVPPELDMWFDGIGLTYGGSYEKNRSGENGIFCLKGNKVNVYIPGEGFISNTWKPIDNSDLLQALKNADNFLHGSTINWFGVEFPYSYFINDDLLYSSKKHEFIDSTMAKTIAKNQKKSSAELDQVKKMNKEQIAKWIKNGGRCRYGFGLWNDTKKKLSKEEALKLLPDYDFGMGFYQLSWSSDDDGPILCFKELHENDLW